MQIDLMTPLEIDSVMQGGRSLSFRSQHAGRDLSKVFDQFLRTTQIPVLEYRIEGSTLSYRWADVVPGFDMPVGVTLSDDSFSVIHPTETWQTTTVGLANPKEFEVDPDYYVIARKIT